MKKILLTLLLIIFFIGSVSASENITDIESSDETINVYDKLEIVQNDVPKIYVNATREISGNGSSWDEAYSGNHWNEIHYDSNGDEIDNCIVYLSEGQYTQDSPLNYNNCTFIGQGENTVISFFADNTNTNSKCRFINITFIKKINSEDNSAYNAILRANYDFINCTFIDLPMVKVMVWPASSYTSFQNCIFKDSNQKKLITNGYYGNLLFDKCTFENIGGDSIVYNEGYMSCSIIKDCNFKNCNVKGILCCENDLAGSKIINITGDIFKTLTPAVAPFYFNSTDNFEIYVNVSSEVNGDGNSWGNASKFFNVYNGLIVHLAEGEYSIPNEHLNVTYIGLGDKTIINSFSLGGEYYTITDNLVTVINATFIVPESEIYGIPNFQYYNILVDSMNFKFVNCKFINSTFISRVYNKQDPYRNDIRHGCVINFDKCIFKDYNGTYLINNWEYSRFIFNECIFENITADAIVDSYGGHMGDNGITDGIYIYQSEFKNCKINGIVKSRNIVNCEILKCNYDFNVNNNVDLISPFYVNKTDVPLNETKLTITTKDNSVIITLTDVNASKPIVGVEIGIFNNGKVFDYLDTDSNGQIILKDLEGSYSFEFSYLGDPYAYLPVSVNKTFTFTKTQSQTTTPSKTVSTTPKVTKKASKITAKKATFKKSKKVKKYSITLKAGKNPIKKVKVYLKVKGKTYKVTTNAKGKATFKITKLTRKGTFTAKISFKGNSLYKAVSKSIKIKVK